ncbi:hypothetical protein ACFQ1L_12375 [Phytohabitans flavus]|uniref:hypothetical protein n=1 Tax=Phytohabitans flavus TaxID=1076124 RepID=UPI001566CA81|nr:hypothetical protein [Phytohabitans flavus]
MHATDPAVDAVEHRVVPLAASTWMPASVSVTGVCRSTGLPAATSGTRAVASPSIIANAQVSPR